jgi:uncharacterized membrane protein YfbV (UPF0208 family)
LEPERRLLNKAFKQGFQIQNYTLKKLRLKTIPIKTRIEKNTKLRIKFIPFLGIKRITHEFSA